MQRILFLLIIVIALVAGYLYLQPTAPQQTGDVGDASVTPQTEQQAKAHINRLTQGSEQPIDINNADNFVTADQLIALPKAQTRDQAGISLEEDQSNPVAPNADATFAVSTHLNVLGTKPKAGDTHSNVSVPLQLASQVKLMELLDNPDQASQKVYFIHAVNEGDDEGLWGIIQHGLMKTFTTGLTLPGLDKTVYVSIPKDADEQLNDKRSSFLGQVLKRKVDQTYIYNYKQGILGDNPNLIKPGQQLVIVTFSEQELIGIYNHFVNL